MIWLDRSITTGIRPERLDAFLRRDDIHEDPFDLAMSGLTMTVACGERTFTIDPVELQAKVRLANRTELEAANGSDTDVSAHWECVEGENIYIVLLDPGVGD